MAWSSGGVMPQTRIDRAEAAGAPPRAIGGCRCFPAEFVYGCSLSMVLGGTGFASVALPDHPQEHWQSQCTA